MNTCASDRKIDIQSSITNNLSSKLVDKPNSVNETKFFKNASENIKPIEARTARIVTLPHTTNPPNLHSSERLTKVENSRQPLNTPKVQPNENLNFSQKIYPKTIYSEIKGHENRRNMVAGGFTPTVFINKRLVKKQTIDIERKN